MPIATSETPTLTESPDCTPQAVRDWMVQRQVGLYKETALGGKQVTVVQAMLYIQALRRELEDLPRPACADELYILTIFRYDNDVDRLAFLMEDNTTSIGDMNNRLKRYTDTVDPLYSKLQAIAGVDIKKEADKIFSPNTPTPEPTSEPKKTISFEGKTGGSVLGPVDIPTGIYRMLLTGPGALSVTITTVSGSCGGSSIAIGSDESKAEAVFKSTDCRALLQIGKTQTPWKLEFIPVE
jgi:hypothetical protein